MKSDDLKNLLEWAVILGAGYVVFRAWQSGAMDQAQLPAAEPQPLPASHQLSAPVTAPDPTQAGYDRPAPPTMGETVPPSQPTQNSPGSDFFKLRMAMPSKWGAN